VPVATSAWLIAIGLLGCAADQIVPLSVDPAPVEVYVDGRRVDSDDPGHLALRSDRSHVVLIRRMGYRPAQVVVESVRTPDGPRLRPERIVVRLEPEQSAGRRIRIELDPADDRPDEATPASGDQGVSEPTGASRSSREEPDSR